VKKIQPSSGLVDGGTIIDITGGWFDEKPQYGVFSFCKIGNSIIKVQISMGSITAKLRRCYSINME
jgi:hypothetical protein